MKVCILGSGLSALTLAKALVNQKIYVDLCYSKNNLKIDKSRTLGISKSNFDYFNSNIIKIEKIIWKLKKINTNQFEGTAGDVEGVAFGETAGNAFYFVYDLNLPVDDSTYVINFEDWMFLMDENTLLSRSYMSKWGFDVGEVTLVMTKTL